MNDTVVSDFAAGAAVATPGGTEERPQEPHVSSGTTRTRPNAAAAEKGAVSTCQVWDLPGFYSINVSAGNSKLPPSLCCGPVDSIVFVWAHQHGVQMFSLAALLILSIPLGSSCAASRFFPPVVVTDPETITTGTGLTLEDFSTDLFPQWDKIVSNATSLAAPMASVPIADDVIRPIVATGDNITRPVLATRHSSTGILSSLASASILILVLLLALWLHRDSRKSAIPSPAYVEPTEKEVDSPLIVASVTAQEAEKVRAEDVKAIEMNASILAMHLQTGDADEQLARISTAGRCAKQARELLLTAEVKALSAEEEGEERVAAGEARAAVQQLYDHADAAIAAARSLFASASRFVSEREEAARSLMDNIHNQSEELHQVVARMQRLSQDNEANAQMLLVHVKTLQELHLAAAEQMAALEEASNGLKSGSSFSIPGEYLLTEPRAQLRQAAEATTRANACHNSLQEISSRMATWAWEAGEAARHASGNIIAAAQVWAAGRLSKIEIDKLCLKAIEKAISASHAISVGKFHSAAERAERQLRQLVAEGKKLHDVTDAVSLLLLATKVKSLQEQAQEDVRCTEEISKSLSDSGVLPGIDTLGDGARAGLRDKLIPLAEAAAGAAGLAVARLTGDQLIDVGGAGTQLLAAALRSAKSNAVEASASLRLVYDADGPSRIQETINITQDFSERAIANAIQASRAEAESRAWIQLKRDAILAANLSSPKPLSPDAPMEGLSTAQLMSEFNEKKDLFAAYALAAEMRQMSRALQLRGVGSANKTMAQAHLSKREILDEAKAAVAGRSCKAKQLIRMAALETAPEGGIRVERCGGTGSVAGGRGCNPRRSE